ncbi:MAG TPA: type II secretion system protein [Candidatus Paceibacterota bacterium]|nr:type II secretion system protein [Candidatus Paceibacterota bacterium]
MTTRGITLLELLIAMAIATGVIAIVTTFSLDVAEFGTDLNARLEGERDLALTLRTMLTEVRSMGPGENGAYPIAIATDTEFAFFADTDNDGIFEQIRYFLDGTTLKKGVIEPTDDEPAAYPPANEIVIDAARFLVPGPVFSYYPEGYPPDTGSLAFPIDLNTIRMIGVSGTTDIDPLQPPLPATLSIYITIRNLRGEI